jgi:hypothetical protein
LACGEEADVAELYVAGSKELSKWAADVGLTKHVYKVGVSQGAAEEAVDALNEATFAGFGDWKLVRKAEAAGIDEATATERLKRKEKMVDPGYYPRIKGAAGLFKARVGSVASHLLVKRTMEGAEDAQAKVKTGDVADYLIRTALG